MSEHQTIPIRLAGKEHAVKEVALSFFFASPIVRPSKFKSLLGEEFSEEFNRFEQIREVKFSTPSKEGDNTDPEAKSDDDAGFQFLQIEDGEVARVLQGRNEEERFYIAFQSMKYKRWADFIEKFQNLAKVITPLLNNMVVIAFGLNYIDELEWTELPVYNIAKIFREDSPYLPKQFFKNRTAQLNLVMEDMEDGFQHLDRIHISSLVSSNTNKAVITISHNIVHRFNSVIDFEAMSIDRNVQELIQKAHQHNKNVLHELLLPEICDLISLNI